MVYLDDGIVAVKGKKEAMTVSSKVQADLAAAGFVVNAKKSCWLPLRATTWLGFDIDLNAASILVPITKVTALQNQLQRAVGQKYLGVREMASIVGKIISMCLALGPITRFMTRSLYSVINAWQSWCQMVSVSPEAHLELNFWLSNLQRYNGQNIWHSPSVVRIVYSDASNVGYGGFTVEHGPQIAHGMWTREEAQESSTWRELVGVLRVLKSLAPKLSNNRLRWFSDNQNVIRILTTGSSKPQLHVVALNVFNLCIQYQIHLEPEWIPRNENE